MATIDPSQTYDMVYTLKCNYTGGNIRVEGRRNGSSAAGTFYYRYGTTGSWTSVNTIPTGGNYIKYVPVNTTEIQIAINLIASSGHYYMIRLSDQLQSIIDEVSISQKAIISGSVGNNFLESFISSNSVKKVDIPNVSGVTSAGGLFMYSYASGCSALTNLDSPAMPNLISGGGDFMANYAYGCSSLISLALPDIPPSATVGTNSFLFYALNTNSLRKLILPDPGFYGNSNINLYIPNTRRGIVRGYVKDIADLEDWRNLTQSGSTLNTSNIKERSLVVDPNYSPPGFMMFFN